MAGAGFLTSACLTFSLLIWPDVVKQHPGYVKGLWIIAMAFWIWALMSYWTDRPLEHSVTRSAIHQATTGTANLNNTGSIGTVNNTVNYHTVPANITSKEAARTFSDVAATKPKWMSLELLSHGDQSQILRLEVINRTESAEFSAQLRLVSRSDEQPVDTTPYVGQWISRGSDEHYADGSYATVSSTILETGIGGLLEVASWDHRHSDDIAVMRLIRTTSDLVWDFRLQPPECLPFFTLQIDFFAKGFESLRKTYRVGPKHHYGPLTMKEVAG